jgi:ABC-type glycerol-3-phosphate transport system permease component
VKGKKFWLPVISFLAATPVCLFLGIASGGVGHGDYVLARILFPFTMLAAVVFAESITVPLIVLAVAQYPLYGIILGAANVRGKMLLASVILLAAHAVFAVACFILPG